MVNYSMEIDRTFSALGDSTRRGMVQRLALGEATVTELAQPFAISLPAISKHLRVLEDAGLLVRVKEGRIHRCQLNVEPLQKAQQWIDRYTAFWNTRLDSLETYFQSSSSDSPAKESNTWKNPLPSQSARSKSPETIPPVRKPSSKRGRIPKH